MVDSSRVLPKESTHVDYYQNTMNSSLVARHEIAALLVVLASGVVVASRLISCKLSGLGCVSLVEAPQQLPATRYGNAKLKSGERSRNSTFHVIVRVG